MKTVAEMTPQEIAEASAQAMWNDDSASQRLGMSLDLIAPGHATLSMTVTEAMSNGHGNCHGGYIFTLADSAFAFACNSRNALTVASGFGIDILKSAKLNDVLTATAEESSLAGRTGLYDITVKNQHGELIAMFRGRSYRLGERKVFEA